MVQTSAISRRLCLVLNGLLLVLPLWVNAKSPAATEAAIAQTPVNDDYREHPIELRFEGVALYRVMEEVSRRSGARFLVSEHIRRDQVDLAIRAADWRSAITSLLERFNHLAIVDRKGDFRRIWITGVKAPVAASHTAVHSPNDLKATGQEGPALSRTGDLPIAIWQPIESSADAQQAQDFIPSAPIQLDPDFFNTLAVGHPVEIPIPQEGLAYFGVVGENHSQLGGRVEVWSGPLDGSHDTASFTISRGEITTYVTVATGRSIYEVNIDNLTGIGRVVDETDLTKDAHEQDFVIPEPPKTLPAQGPRL